jgi:hypothetical protein
MKTRSLLLLLVPLFIQTCLFTVASAQWNWAMRAGGGYRDFNDPSWICTDKHGDVIFAGCFVNMGDGDIDGQPIPDCPVGGFSALIIKYASTGEKRWVRYFGNNGGLWNGGWGAQARGVAVDSSNNIYVVGTFTKTMTVEGTDYTAAGGDADTRFDIFLCKYDPDGKLLWMRTFGAPSVMDYTLFFSPIHVTPSGKVIILGVHGGAITFGDKSITANEGNYFIAQFTPDGACDWVKGYGSMDPKSHSDVPSTFDVDLAGNIYVTATEMYLKSKPSDPEVHILYLMKLDSAGNEQWKIRESILPYVKTDRENVINYGTFMGSIFTQDWRVTAKNNDNDIAIARYTFDGKFITRTAFGGEKSDFISSIDIGANGDLYFSYASWGPVTIAGDQYGEPDFISGFPWVHSFLVRSDPNGTIKQYGKQKVVRLSRVTADRFSNALIATGQIDSIDTFNGKVIEPIRDASSTGFCSDLFIGKFSFNTSSVKAKANEQPSALYPNPASTLITISLPDQWPEAYTDLVISDVTGREIKRLQLQQQKQRIDVSMLSQGVYHARVIGKKIRQVGVFTVQR